MKVLCAIQELRTGGAEHVVVALTRGLQSAGHDVATAAAPGELSDRVTGARFPLPLLRRRPHRVPRAAWALRTAIKRWRPDVVHAHNPGMAVVLSAATRRGSTAPGVVSFHGVPDEDYPRAARALRVAGLPVVACGPGVATALAEHGVDVRDTIVNGIGPAPAPADRAALLREWGLPPKAALLVSVGRLVPQKNHALAIAALAHVPDAALAILGEGDLHDELRQAIDDHGLGERVILAGVRPDARAIIAASDATILASRWEGLPLVALESLAAGTPLVATAVRGLIELLVDETTALLTPPGDERALAGAINRLLGDADLRSRLAAAGRDVARQYSEQAMIDRYLALYREIARERG